MGSGGLSHEGRTIAGGRRFRHCGAAHSRSRCYRDVKESFADWLLEGFGIGIDAGFAGNTAVRRTGHTPIPAGPERETNLSQVFIALDPASMEQAGTLDRLADQIVEHFQSSVTGGERVRYPGERVLQTRSENLAKGIPVEPAIWREIQQLDLAL